MTSLEKIVEFNEKAGLLGAGYSDERECAYSIEEMLEGFHQWRLTNLNDQLQGHPEHTTPKYISRKIMDLMANGHPELEDITRFDKHLDAVVYNIGSMLKLGLTLDQILRGLGIVMDRNLEKLSVGTDSHGKQMKPEGFVGPEEELQKILDER